MSKAPQKVAEVGPCGSYELVAAAVVNVEVVAKDNGA